MVRQRVMQGETMRYAATWAVGIGLIATAAGCGNGDSLGTNPTIAMTSSKSALAIAQGASDNLRATITRAGGYNGAVAIVAEGIPTGVTATVSNVATSGTTTAGTITLAVGSTVTPGAYTVTVRASGTGVTDATVSLALTVTLGPSIRLSTRPATLPILQGANATTTVTIVRTNFTGAVALTLEGAPAGVTGVFAAASAADATSVLTITVGATAVTGPYPLTIRGAGTGIADATTSFVLTVGVTSYTLGAITPNPISISQGANAAVTVLIARTNFTGTVDLTLEGMPAGLTGAFVPAAVTANSSSLNLSVGAAVPAAPYTLTVRGVSTGQADQTATFVVSVTTVISGGNTSLGYSDCSAATTPVWLAYQDGTSRIWTPVRDDRPLQLRPPGEHGVPDGRFRPARGPAPGPAVPQVSKRIAMGRSRSTRAKITCSITVIGTATNVPAGPHTQPQ